MRESDYYVLIFGIMCFFFLCLVDRQNEKHVIERYLTQVHLIFVDVRGVRSEGISRGSFVFRKCLCGVFVIIP